MICRRLTGSSLSTRSSTARSAREQLLRVRGFFDLYDVATQLGILPARGTLGEKALCWGMWAAGVSGCALRETRNT